jgi:hypothetical protein
VREAISSDIVSPFIIRDGGSDRGQRAAAIRPRSGGGSHVGRGQVRSAALLPAGLFGASLPAASVVPLSTSYAFAEAAEQTAIRFGKCQRSPLFYGIFIDQIMIGAGIALVRAISPPSSSRH